MSDIFKALSSPVRRDILFMLRDRDMTAGEIADRLPVGKATLSGHFNVLKAADLVRTERQGTTIVYSLNMSVVEELLAMTAALAGRGKERGKKSEETSE